MKLKISGLKLFNRYRFPGMKVRILKNSLRSDVFTSVRIVSEITAKPSVNDEFRSETTDITIFFNLVFARRNISLDC